MQICGVAHFLHCRWLGWREVERMATKSEFWVDWLSLIKWSGFSHSIPPPFCTRRTYFSDWVRRNESLTISLHNIHVPLSIFFSHLRCKTVVFRRIPAVDRSQNALEEAKYKNNTQQRTVLTFLSLTSRWSGGHRRHGCCNVMKTILVICRYRPDPKRKAKWVSPCTHSCRICWNTKIYHQKLLRVEAHTTRRTWRQVKSSAANYAVQLIFGPTTPDRARYDQKNSKNKPNTAIRVGIRKTIP